MEDMIPDSICMGCFNWSQKTEKHSAKCLAFTEIWERGSCPAYIDKEDHEKIRELKTAISSYKK